MTKMEAIVEKLINKFEDLLTKQMETFQSIMLKRMETMEVDIHNLKCDVDKFKEENEKLRSEMKVKNREMKDLRRKAGDNRGQLLDLKQEKVAKEVLLITKDENFTLPVGTTLLQQVPVRKPMKDKCLTLLNFKSIDDKIELLKRKKSLADMNIISVLCKEKRELLGRANKLRNEGKFQRVWVHRDNIFAEWENGDKYCIKSELDLEFLC